MKLQSVNFIEREFVSVSEQKKNKKLTITSSVAAMVFFALFIVVFGLNYFLQRQLFALNEQQKQLAAQLEMPDNKKKELLYYLVRDRLKKINEIKKTRIDIADELSQIKKITEIFAVKNIYIDGRTARFTVETDNYDKFNDFLKTARDKYNINRKSVLISQTDFKDKIFTISLSFNFL